MSALILSTAETWFYTKDELHTIAFTENVTATWDALTRDYWTYEWEQSHLYNVKLAEEDIHFMLSYFELQQGIIHETK